MTIPGQSFIYNCRDGLCALDLHEQEKAANLQSQNMCRYIRGLEQHFPDNYSEVTAIAHRAGIISVNDAVNFGQATFKGAGLLLLNGLHYFFSSFMVDNFGAEQVKTPDLYQSNGRLLALQKLFGEEPYFVDDSHLLRPASDFGVFLMHQNSQITVPKRIFELASCYRKEERSRVDFLSRPMSFSMPDLHCFIDPLSVEQEGCFHLDTYAQLFSRMNLDYVISVRTTKNSLQEMIPIFEHVAMVSDREIYVNVVPSRKRYWTTKFKFIVMGEKGRGLQLATVQTDFDSAKLFDIRCDSGFPAIIHSSPGSLERWIYALVERGQSEKGITLPGLYFNDGIANTNSNKDVFVPFRGGAT